MKTQSGIAAAIVLACVLAIGTTTAMSTSSFQMERMRVLNEEGSGRRGGFSIPLHKAEDTIKLIANGADPKVEISKLHWRLRGRAFPIHGGIYTMGAYFVNVTVGSGAGQVTVQALADTGSPNTAISSVECTTCKSNKKYNISRSPTAQLVPFTTGNASNDPCQNCIPYAVGTDTVPDPGTIPTVERCMFGRPMNESGVCGFAISYGGTYAGITGVTVRDFACIGSPLNPSRLCGHDIFINLIENQYPTGTLSMGVLGLSFPHNACNPSCQPTILDSLVAQGVLKPEQDRYGMCLDAASGGNLDVGEYNPEAYYGNMSWAPLVKEHWFNIHVKAIKVNGVDIGVPEFMLNIVNEGLGAFVDSGTAGVFVSPYAFDMITDLMSTNYSYLPCVQQLFVHGDCCNMTNAEAALYPPISFTIRGNAIPDTNETQYDTFDISMSGSNYLVLGPLVDPSFVTPSPHTPSPYGVPTPPPQLHQFCLALAGVPSVAVVLGDVIMTNYYIAFDRYNKQVGFAPIKKCG